MIQINFIGKQNLNGLTRKILSVLPKKIGMNQIVTLGLTKLS